MVRKTTASKLAVDKSQKRRLLKVASYNINGINPRLPVLLRWLDEFQPDIVGLQELKCTDQAFPASDIEALGYSAIWHGEQRWNGVALLARGCEPAHEVAADEAASAGDENPHGGPILFRRDEAFEARAEAFAPVGQARRRLPLAAED